MAREKKKSQIEKLKSKIDTSIELPRHGRVRSSVTGSHCPRETFEATLRLRPRRVRHSSPRVFVRILPLEPYIHISVCICVCTNGVTGARDTQFGGELAPISPTVFEASSRSRRRACAVCCIYVMYYLHVAGVGGGEVSRRFIPKSRTTARD